MSAEQTVIFFIRHGETNLPYSADKQLDSQRVLTEKGREQMEKVGEYLRAFAPSAIYSSPLKRTIECAEIIKEQAAIKGEIAEKPELLEIYSEAAYKAIKSEVAKVFDEIIATHAGEQVVCVSHQDVIQGALDAFGLTSAEKDFPCRMGEGYRLVFAGETLVECQKINPAKV